MTQRTRTGRKRVSSARVRLRRVAALAILASIVLGARLATVQILNGARYAAYLNNEVEQRITLPATRGAIYDRAGDALAVSVQRTDVIADDFQISTPAKEARSLAPLLKVSPAKLTGELSEHNGFVVLARALTDSEVAPIEAASFAGLTFAPDPVRVTSGGGLFQPILGGVNAAGQGDGGIEYSFNALLAGKPGSEIAAIAPGGITLPAKPKDVVAARAGTGLVLTIDEPLQVEAERDVAAQMVATHAKSGIAVVMDVHTGAILAMVDLVATKHGKIVPAANNLAATSVYQPGSVMKLATITFALEAGLITPSTVFTVPDSINVGGYTFQDAEPHGIERLTVAQILAQSSNVGTIEIAKRLGEQRLAQALAAYGFGHLSGLGWPGESPGLVGSPATWYGSAAASVPIGTGIAVTPLQVLDAYNTVANGGVYVAPHIVAGLVNGGGVEHLLAASVGSKRVNSATVQELVPMLEGVVQDGTAVLAQIPGYTVAGKTGTAQVPETKGLGYVPGDWNATFVGFVPAQEPQLAGIVVLNRPTPIYGGIVSAPVFAKILRYALRRFDIAPPPASVSLTSVVGAGTKK